MNQSILMAKKPKIIYANSNEKLMSDNIRQFRYIVIIKENLELVFAHNPNGFIT